MEIEIRLDGFVVVDLWFWKRSDGENDLWWRCDDGERYRGRCLPVATKDERSVALFRKTRTYGVV